MSPSRSRLALPRCWQNRIRHYSREAMSRDEGWTRSVWNDIAVIVPAYNASATLSRALRSVTAQSLRPAVLIVVDDASTDNTAEIARRDGALVFRRDVPGGAG